MKLINTKHSENWGVKIENLTIDFGTVKAVNNISWEAKDGELVCLLGPSGCGKSTTLNALAGLTGVSSGKILFGNKDVTDLPPQKRNIGLVFQNYALYPHMTVRKNILYPLKNDKELIADIKAKGLNKRTVLNDKVNEVAKMVGITDQLNKRPRELSGGQQQRVAIARALVKNADVLLLDEPLSNLDAKLRVSTREWIRTLQQKLAITTIFVTHDQEEAMTISDTIVVMSNGHVQQTGHPQDVYNRPKNKFVAGFIGTPAMNFFEAEVVSGKVMLDGKAIADTKAKKGKIWIGVRPNHVYGNVEGAKDVYQTGTEVNVTLVQDLGREALLNATCGEQEVRIITKSDNLDDMKKKFNISFKKGKVYIFEHKSEELVDII